MFSPRQYPIASTWVCSITIAPSESHHRCIAVQFGRVTRYSSPAANPPKQKTNSPPKLIRPGVPDSVTVKNSLKYAGSRIASDIGMCQIAPNTPARNQAFELTPTVLPRCTRSICTNAAPKQIAAAIDTPLLTTNTGRLPRFLGAKTM